MDLTVELAALYMLVWDRKFLNLTRKLGLELDMYKHYVDDSGQSGGAIYVGWEFNKESGKMIYKDGAMYDGLPPDQRTLYIPKDIGNTLDDSVQMEADVQSMHPNGRLPVLDLELWVCNNICIYGFYSKDKK